MRKSSDRYLSPDNKTGYGAPDMKKAFVDLLKKLQTQHVFLKDCKSVIQWSAKSNAAMNFVIERKLPNDAGYSPIYIQSVNSDFAINNFSYTDDLSGVSTPSNINYRIKLTYNITTNDMEFVDKMHIQNCMNCSVLKFNPSCPESVNFRSRYIYLF
jgi:hypothetical protein